MNLLPSIDEIAPITEVSNVFFQTDFSQKFTILPFEKKLQVLCDLVRQSIYPNGFPNPDSDILDMNGNCYTAAYTFINYIKELNIGSNYRCAIVRKRCFDLDNVTSIHVVALVDGANGHTYQVDPTPFAGYKYGSVDDITYQRIYEEYVIIDEKIREYLYEFRKIIYDDSQKQFDKSKIGETLELCRVINEFPILKGYAALAIKTVTKYLDDDKEKEKIRKLLSKIKPCNRDNSQAIKETAKKLKQMTEEWKEELMELQLNNANPKRQQELAMTIIHENKWLNDSLEKYADINGKKVRLSSLNPRFFYENKLRTIILPKSQFLAKSTIQKNVLLKNRVFSYSIDTSLPRGPLNLDPCLFSYNHQDYLNEKISVFLLRETNEVNTLIQDIGNPSPDSNYSEQVLDFLLGYPEHQTMTCFMYPNPKLLIKTNKT